MNDFLNRLRKKLHTHDNEAAADEIERLQRLVDELRADKAASQVLGKRGMWLKKCAKCQEPYWVEETKR